MTLLINVQKRTPDIDRKIPLDTEALIVIHDSDENIPDAQSGMRLDITFDDEDDIASSNGICISHPQAARIAQFAHELDAHANTADIQLTVCCKGGVCRSAAIASALCAHFHGSDAAVKRFFDTDQFLPNRLVFDVVSNHARNGQTSRFWDDAFAHNTQLFDEKHELHTLC